MATDPKPGEGARAGDRAGWARGALSLAGVLALSLLLTEGALRLFFADRFPRILDERNLSYRHDPELGWAPVPGSEGTYRGAREISVRHNSAGFRDVEHGAKNGRRLAVFGDSFVWGYDAEHGERFTDLLALSLPEWQVMNLGVSGYGTDQSALLAERLLPEIEPDLVLLVFCATNDRDDNRTNLNYGGYYKPYFERTPEGIALRGVPVPQGANYFNARHPLWSRSALVRAVVATWVAWTEPAPVVVDDPTEALMLRIRRIAQTNGAPLVVALQGRDPELARALKKARIPFVLVETPYAYPSHGGHWTPQGHEQVAEKLQAFLARQGLIDVGA